MKTNKTCLGCCSEKLDSIIKLGEQPLANSLIKEIEKVHSERFYNLEVMLCADCGLAQLKDIINPSDLFSDYVYFSSYSQTVLDSAKEIALKTCKELNKESFVVEIASNDGYLLKNYVEQGFDVLGIDPAQNIAEFANAKGINTLSNFFTEELANKIATEKKRADVIHANNVMAHVPNINDFIKGIKALLHKQGKAIIEVPYFVDLIQKLEFDTIYHEHVYYFLVKPLKNIFAKHNLELFNVERIPLHGGTIRLFVGHLGAYKIQPAIDEHIAQENQMGMYEAETYKKFMDKIFNLKETLLQTLQKIKEDNKKIVAYGASAKGATLLNFFGIGKHHLDFVVDRSLAKQNLYTPGTHLPIYAPETLLDVKPDYVLLLTWNFADEIMQQQESYRQLGGKFIIPIPELQII